MKNKIPKIARYLLKFLLPAQDKDSILYTYEQLFSQSCIEKGNFKSTLWIFKEIAKSTPGLLFSLISLNFAMTKSYFKLAWRNLAKNKISSSINIAGLAVSVAISLVLFLTVLDKYDKDRFHEKGDRIFAIYSSFSRENNSILQGNTPKPLGPILEQEIPQILKSVRVEVGGRKQVNYKNKTIESIVFKADNEFLNLFDFPLLKGDINGLSDKDGVILTEKFAAKIFGNEDPLNKEIFIKYDDRSDSNGQIFDGLDIRMKSYAFVVKGIIKSHTQNTSFSFDCLLPYDNLAESSSLDQNNWEDYTTATFVLLDDINSYDIVEKQVQSYIPPSRIDNTNGNIEKFVLDNLSNMAINPNEIQYRFASTGMTSALQIIMIVAGFLILAIPCFNFINVAIANADMRLKEIGIRKVVGANIAQLRKQFLIENLLLCIISLVIGIVLCDMYFLPKWYDLTIGFSSNYILSTYLFNYRLWMFLISIVLFTGLSAGGYPAFYVSNFKPVNILRRNLKLNSSKLFSKFTIGIQFVLTFCLLAFTVIIGMQADFLKNMDKGYNSDNVYTVYTKNTQRFELLKNEFAKNPNITRIAGTKNHIGMSFGSEIMKLISSEPEVITIDIGENYFDTMGLNIVDGRRFNENLTSSYDEVIINESFYDQYKNLIENNSIQLNNKFYNIVGRVENFHFSRVEMNKIRPAILRLSPKAEYSFLVFKTINISEDILNNEIKTAWTNVFPNEAANEVIEQLLIEKENTKGFDIVVKIYSMLGIMVLIISCIGLYGLVSLQVSRRRKEISIHKVLGSSVKNILVMLNKEYLKIIGFALLLGSVVSYFALRLLIYSLFAYHFEYSIIPFILIAITILGLTTLTVIHNVYKAATANPVEALREE